MYLVYIETFPLATYSKFALNEQYIATVLASSGAVIEANREFCSALAWRNDQFAEASYHLGLILEQQGKPGEAKHSFERALAQDPSLDEARIALRALSAKIVKSYEYLLTQVKTDAEDVDTWCQLGNICVASGRFIDGADAFFQCLERAPSHSAALRGYGEALEAIGHIDEASSVFQRATSVRPNDAALHAHHGRIILKLALSSASSLNGTRQKQNERNKRDNALQLAIEAMERAIQLAPVLPTIAADAYEGIGDAVSAQNEGNIARAIEAYCSSAILNGKACAGPWLKLARIFEIEVSKTKQHNSAGESSMELRAIEQQFQLSIDAGFAYRKAARALIGDEEAAADAERNISRVIEPVLKSLLDISEETNESNNKGAWWCHTSELRRFLYIFAAIRVMKPKNGSTRYLMAIVSDRLAKVPTITLSRLLQDHLIPKSIYYVANLRTNTQVYNNSRKIRNPH